MLAAVAATPARLRELLATGHDPLVAFTAERRIVAVNDLAERLFGYGSHELDGHPTDDLVPARLRQPGAPPMTATDDLVSVDLPGLRRDGSEIPLAWTFGAVRLPDGPLFVMLVRNRAEIDEAWEALRLSDERFRLLVDGVRDHAIYMLDAAGRVSTWNSGAERLKGWRASEIIGRPYDEMFSYEDRAHGVPARLLTEAVAAGSVEASGWRLRKDGTSFYGNSSLSSIRARDGKTLVGYAVITHDLTARVRAEENEKHLALERAARQIAEDAEKHARISEERLSRIHRMALALSKAVALQEVATAALAECLPEIGAAGGALYLLGPDGATLALLGEHGQPPAPVDACRALPLSSQGPLADATRAGEPRFYESFEQRAGDLEACAAVPLAVRGRTLGVLGIRYRGRRAFDPAERSLVLTLGELCSQALERAQLFEAEQRASRAKDEFLAMLGHELRNPLAPMTTAVQLMKHRKENQGSEECEIIERQLGHMARLVDDLLDVSRIARGSVELARRQVSVADIFARAVEIASPLLEQRSHELTIDERPKGLMLDADPQRMAQVIANLLTNAAKYTPPHGHIALSAALEGDEVVIRARDDGQGIPADLLPHVFDLFVQGERTIDRSQGGLGLGLALVKNLVALHGGTVSAVSEGADRGSEFVVRLPWVRAAPHVEDPAPAARAPARTGKSRRILVVDDNEDSAEALAMALEHFGYQVAFALDGLTALDRLRAFPADVAFLDLGLPVIDGFELARRIIREFPDRPPRLVAVTGYGQKHDVTRSAAAGFEAHLTKPVDLDALVAAVERVDP